jgi:ABC-type branched-subunit amino acid transport system substrate-binding protein
MQQQFISGRRRLLGAAGVALAGAIIHRPALALASDTVTLGQSVALSGPLTDLGQAMHQGALACFSEVNAGGGIAGRRIELKARDDGYDVKRAVANFQALLAEPDVFALFNCMGTPMNEALMPLIRNTEMPCFAPFTGAMSAYPGDMRNVFNIRPSYVDETQRLVEHLATVAIRKVAVACQNNSFGKEVKQAAETAIQRWHLDGVAVASVENSGADAEAAAAKIAAAGPQAVLIGLAGKPALNFVRAMRRQEPGVLLYTLSVMGSAATLNALGADASGLVVTQVMPLPTNGATPLVRDFLKAWSRLGTPLEPSHIGLEGYVNARVFVEVLRRAGPQLDRRRFIDAAWAMKHLDLGGYELGFTQPGASASRFVELTMVQRGGRFIR